MFQAKLPLYLWRHSVLTAVYLINRIPSSPLSHKTPYEILFGHEPTYDHLRVFGCLCYASTLSHNRSKFDPRAKKCVFLGYPFGVKGYKVYDISTKSVFISRDIIFHEDIFPFAGENATVVDPFLSDFELQGNASSSLGIDTFVTLVIIPDTTSVFSHTSAPNVLLDFVLTSVSNSVSNSIVSSLPVETSDSLLADLPDTDFIPSSHFPLVPPSALLEQASTSTIKAPPAPTRKSARPSKPPAYLQDYSCAFANLPASGGPYDIAHSLTYAHLMPSYQSYVLAVSSNPQEPQNFFQVVKDPLGREAMDKEIQALEQNHTWELTSLPLGKTPIGCKWVYRIKFKSNGTVDRYKTRLVAKGYTQKEGALTSSKLSHL